MIVPDAAFGEHMVRQVNGFGERMVRQVNGFGERMVRQVNGYGDWEDIMTSAIDAAGKIAPAIVTSLRPQPAATGSGYPGASVPPLYQQTNPYYSQAAAKPSDNKNLLLLGAAGLLAVGLVVSMKK